MAYITKSLCMSVDEVSYILNQMDDINEITVDILLMIHYAYHHEDKDFDGGLNFLDKLYAKLQLYYDICWDIGSIKAIIRSSPNPEFDYHTILSQLLTPGMIQCYGV